MTDQPHVPTSDERLMAALSHFLGFIVALFIWATQKDKSRFVRFQAVQAMAFYLVVGILTIIVIGFLMLVISGFLALGLGGIAITANHATEQTWYSNMIYIILGTMPFIIPCITIPWIVLVYLARLIATIQTFQGKDFYYPWLGKLVEQYQEH